MISLSTEEGAELLERIRIDSQPVQEPATPSGSMPYSHPVVNESANAPTGSDLHPSWWIQDFLHTTLGIARRKKSSPESPEIAKEGGKSVQDPDPASTSGQIQLWQVKLLGRTEEWNFIHVFLNFTFSFCSSC